MTLSRVSWLIWFSAVYVSFTGPASAQTVTLTSSVEQDGRQAACPGEVVTFTCVMTDTEAIQWIVETQTKPLRFAISNDAGNIQMDDSGQFLAVLTDITRNGLFANFVSELTVTADETLHETVVRCSTGVSTEINNTLTKAALPSPPQQEGYSVSLYQLSNFSVVVHWESPASDGGVGIDNYTLTGAGITAPLTVLSNEPLMTTLTLSYNEMHMVSITASNCAGDSAAAVVTINEVGCGPPTPPPYGSLGDLTSSQEGAEVTFQCNPGLVPSQQMVSVCAANGYWTLDPAELICRVDCGDPSPPMNGFVMAYNSTLEGSQIVFQCSPGFVPSQQMMSVCAANGSWTPDPAELVCRVDCGMPILINGSVNYTTTVEGSTATYQCNVGLTPEEVITAICMGNGEWAPDPADTGCRQSASCGVPPSPASGSVKFTTTLEGSIAAFQCDTGLVPEERFAAVCIASGEWVPNIGDLSCSQPEPLSQGLSTAEAVGVTFVLSSIVSFTAGLLVALGIAYCYIRQQKSQYSPRNPEHPVPMYEEVSMVTSRDIELKENVAYGPVSR